MQKLSVYAKTDKYCHVSIIYFTYYSDKYLETSIFLEIFDKLFMYTYVRKCCILTT